MSKAGNKKTDRYIRLIRDFSILLLLSFHITSFFLILAQICVLRLTYVQNRLEQEKEEEREERREEKRRK